MNSDRVPLLKNEDVLIVPVHDELSDLEANQLESNLLDRVSKGDITGVVLDISSLRSMDLFTTRKLIDLVKMIGLMDVETVIVGMRPAVALTLAEMEISLPNIRTAITLEQGLARLKRKKTK